MIMYLCDEWYNLEKSSYEDMEQKNRVIKDPKYVPTKGDFIFLGYNPCQEVRQVVYDYEHNMIVVICYAK